jgi:hypothetical protein
MNNNILVVKSLNYFSLPVVFFFRFFMKINRVYVYKNSLLFFKSFWFKFLSIEYCNFENCTDLNTSPYFGKDGDNIDKVVDEFLDKHTIEIFSQFLVNIKDPDEKFRLLIRDYVLTRCRQLIKISIWINSSFHSGKDIQSKVYYLGSTCKISESFLLKECHRVKLMLILPSNLYLLFEVIHMFLFSKLFSFFKVTKFNKKSKSDTNNLYPMINNQVDTLAYKVIFFPHQSIYFGGLSSNQELLRKDYFYSTQKDSAFHPSKILHIEFSNLFLSGQKAKYYIDNDIDTVLFPRISIRTNYKNIIYIINALGLIKILKLLKKNFTLFFISTRATLKFLSSIDLVDNFYNPNLVCVGSENNFPITLSLAFESLKVKTVSIQERFILAFYSNVNFNIDTYLCNSSFISGKLQVSKSKFVNHCIPCGQIRSDFLFDYQESIIEHNTCFTIVAFDYHSEVDISQNRIEPLINWKANKSFYKDLCRLSENIANIQIIIRGKNLNWTKNKYFEDILQLMNNNPNIIISSDYSINAQYKISAKADLIIAKHTSICDELLTIGKQVIFHDFLPNSRNVICHEFDYNDYNIFANSYIELELMVKSVMNKNKLLSESKLLELQKIINDGPADGLVKERIMSNLNILYQEKLNKIL